MLHYCTKCGRMIFRGGIYGKPFCDFCKNEVYPIPEEYMANELSIKPELREQFIKEYIESSPDFDPELQKARIQHNIQVDNQLGRVNQMVKNQNSGVVKSNSHGVTCPYCHSTNTKKISTVSKGVNVGLFGIFGMRKVVKQWHCNGCGSDF